MRITSRICMICSILSVLLYFLAKIMYFSELAHYMNISSILLVFVIILAFFFDDHIGY
ncbi:hypothetical protein GKZ89_13065 [Bacillus mangrovi]|uniref:Uncharacterized protein n=1 Tax=Metabacillus mangrovi TaxID=1491830 RepID=A0A7X2S6E1_9BACI|nr:hypothetical protein [Metabacillus mangrovi]MTH54335.1 hypothetical protein [Metabacillus mangrovi]